MTDIKPENKGFYRATLFLRSLLRQGVNHVIISPGSRSTPLTMAAAVLTALQKHIILDERSAAFTALGIGKSTNQPAAIICTSGTAVANYYPAVIEARKSGVPLLLLTADRPAHLHGTGANQTINQQHIYGEYPVNFYDMSEHEKQNSDYFIKIANQAHHQSRENQGPVHINFPFSKPLEPKTGFLQKIVAENEDINPAQTPEDTTKSFHFDEEVLDAFAHSDQPLIIVGQLAPGSILAPIFSLAAKLHAPVLSEQGIHTFKYAVNGFEGFLRKKRAMKNLAPDLIVRFGRQPASKSVLQAIKNWDPDHHIHISDTEWQSNIENSTTKFIQWNGHNFKTDNLDTKPTFWLKKWKDIEKEYFDISEQLFDTQKKLTDGHIYKLLVPKIPGDWSVFISNSFPARDQSMFGRWGTQQRFTNRGVSGIDGITSTAMGVNIGLSKPGILFTGDLAFLHDSNALLNAKQLQQPLVIVIINNSGGSIFRMLPIADHKEYFNTYFETPQNINISQLVDAHNIKHTLIETIEELKQINLMDFTQPEIHVIECQTDADASMKLREKLWRKS